MSYPNAPTDPGCAAPCRPGLAGKTWSGVRRAAQQGVSPAKYLAAWRRSSRSVTSFVVSDSARSPGPGAWTPPAPRSPAHQPCPAEAQA